MSTSTSTWTGAVSSDWADPDNWSPTGVPGASSDVAIAAGAPVASASIGTVNSITDSYALAFESAGTNTVATFLDDTGHLKVDAKGGEGGTILNIGGTLTNSGHLHIGNATLSASDEVTAASLDNTRKGKIYLTGSSANQALLDVTGSAGFGTASVLSGTVRLARDSAIEFGSGEITRLAASAQLSMNGNDAFLEDSTALGSNSALAGLASIGSGALFALDDGASVSTTGALVNDGNLYLDTGSGDGGSSLTVGGTLTNSGTLAIGNAKLSASDEVTAASLDNTGSISLTGSGADQALLDVTGAAGFGTAEVLSGNVGLVGDSAIEFASGQITSLAASAQLTLNGNDAFVEDSAALGSNSALTGLASIGAGATFTLHDGASVSTTGALVNHGNIVLDPSYADGGSSLTVAGTLTNSHHLSIGNGFLFSASDEVRAASLDNTGAIELAGSGAAIYPSPGNQALLDVTAGSAGFGTAGVLSGHVDLSGDSAIEFASGQITTIAAGSQLNLNGNNAFIEDSSALGSNSALTGLTDIAGSLSLGSASVSIAGPLTNTGSIDLGFGNFEETIGATLDVTSGVAGFGTAGVLSGDVDLSIGAIEFASGQITSLAANAQLTLGGNDAFIEDSTAQGSNSALTGLASIGAGATFDLENGAAASTTGALVNDGTVELDVAAAGAASSLTVGALTNNGSLNMGNGFTTSHAFLDVTAGVAGFGTAGTLTGNVYLYNSAIEFLSGQISTIAASSELTLDGSPALIEDSTALGSNSALTGLADVSGSLYLQSNGQGAASVSTTGALTNAGHIDLQGGGNTLSIGGALTNPGMLEIGNGDAVTADSLDNSGTVDLTGDGTNFAALDVSGATTNNGSISIASDTETLAGAVGGAGSFSLSTAKLQFDSSVSSGQTINETGADKLILEQAQSFAATISGFGTGDTIDATNFVETGTTYNFVENSAMTGGTLTLTDTSLSLTANILMTGDYSNSSFTLAPDSGTGTLVKFV